MPPKEKDSAQTFSFDTVAVLVATIIENGGSLGAKEFKRMSALDGNRGEHGFNHMFRAVKARAKELSDQAKDSGEMTPVKKTKGAGGASAKTDEGANTGAKKRGMRPDSVADVRLKLIFHRPPVEQGQQGR